ELASVERVIAQAMPILQQQQVFAVEIAWLQRLPPDERMVGRGGEPKWIDPDLDRFSAGDIVREGEHRRIKQAGGEALGEIGGKILPEKQFELRIGLLQFRRCPGEKERRD